MLYYLEKRKYLNELSILINRKDKRSIRNWCRINRLKIYKDSSGDFVNENEFEIAYNLPIILNLKKIYGDNWKEYYEIYQNKELHKVIDIKSPSKKSSYKPKGIITSKFFEGS